MTALITESAAEVHFINVLAMKASQEMIVVSENVLMTVKIFSFIIFFLINLFFL